MTIENFGAGARCAEAMRRLVSAEADGRFPDSVKRCILLPVPTSKDKIHLTGTDKLLSKVFSDTKAGDFVAGYGIDDEQKARMRERGAIVYDALDDEDFLAENAELTALGALGYILSTSDKAPSDLSIAVIGYGRIGSRLLRMLLFLGGRVRVFSGREKTCVDLAEMGINATLLPRGSALSTESFDIIVNTAPSDFSASFVGDSLPKGHRVIELASGNNFRGIDGVERLPGIPDKSYGKSAGKVYADRILDYIEREVEKC